MLPPPPAPTGPVRPGPTNTGYQGVPALTRLDGDPACRCFKITQDNYVLDGKDVYAKIIVQANNVTIKRSIVRGDRITGSFEGIIQQLGTNTGLVVEDVTILPQLHDRFQDGMRVRHATIRRVNISTWDIVVDGSDFTATSSGAAIMITAGADRSGRLTAKNSWFAGGGCSLNFTDKSGYNRNYQNTVVQNTVVTNNTFIRGTTGTPDCAIRVTSVTVAAWTQYGNVFHDGTPFRLHVYI